MNAFYNYALLLQKEKKNTESLKIIDRALKNFVNNEKLLYVKLIGEINLNQIERAQETCNILISINPSNENYAQILVDLKNRN